jgi:hypothetical protein
MGQQQLLLIALGIIIVGVAVVVGTNIFTASFTEEVKDFAIQKVHDIGTRANIYRKTPEESGGGGGSYKGFRKSLTKKFLTSDEIVKKIKLREKQNRIDMRLTLQQRGGNKNRRFRVWARYEPDGLKGLRIYDPEKKKWVWIIKPKRKRR